MGDDDLLTELLFTSDSQHVLIAREDGHLEKWDLERAERVLPPMPHGSQIVSLLTSPGGGAIMTHGLDQNLRFWSMETGSESREPTALAVTRREVSYDGPFSLYPGISSVPALVE